MREILGTFLAMALGVLIGAMVAEKAIKRPHPNPGDYTETVFKRHGYVEELLAELQNENGVRLYSDAAGDLYFVYGSTTVPNASYRIEKHSWRK